MAVGTHSPGASRLQRLARRSTGEREAALEHCEMCSAPIAPEHRHLLDVDARELLCVCRACAVLFDRPAAATATGGWWATAGCGSTTSR